MVKTVSVAELGHGGASRAVREAQHEPVLVSKGNHPAAWIISAEDVARLATERGGADIYQRALEVLAVDLYQREALSLGRAAKLAGLSLGDFIDVCDRLQVPVLWESERSVSEQVASFERWLESPAQPGGS